MVNFLGLAEMPFSIGGRTIKVPLEFISQKLDYDTEYRAMTADIADFCSQLLLSWDTPTGLRFSPDPVQQKRIRLEQFLFLRHFLRDAQFDACIEVIRNRTHSELERERNWRPAAMARSTDYLSAPMAMTREWHRVGGGRSPGEVLEVTKTDTFDTAPNRFVRFALEQFERLCREVAADGSASRPQGPPAQSQIEAQQLSSRLRSVLSLPLFRNCGRLARVPLDSQVLQKKEGYRDLLRAWLLVQSASRLNWEGRADCYTGTSRGVDTLYEYWIFLTLHRLLGELGGVELLPGEVSPADGCEPFLQQADGEVKINLNKGAQSVARFRYRPEHAERNGDVPEMRIHVYYERRFQPSGNFSWSGTFKPDYSLMMFPAEFETEQEAADAGKLSFLHFDAKYRAEKISDVFGDWIEEEDADGVHAKAGSAASEDSPEIRLSKKEDLLKMHTYNDAIRRTAGSYVLYPGEDNAPAPKKRFHEILPGVGAFVLKPGNRDCEKFLMQFLIDVFQHQSDRFTQFRYVADATHRTVRDQPGRIEEAGGAGYTVADTAAPCVAVWLKPSDVEIFRAEGFAYCRAIYADDHGAAAKLQLELASESGSQFVPFRGGRRQPLTTYGWRGKTTAIRFLTKERLATWIGQRGLEDRLQPSSASHYLLYEFDEVSAFPEYDISEMAKAKQSGSRYMAFSCKWSELMDCPRLPSAGN